MGLSFGEIVVIAIVALLVLGPRDLPKLLRTAGRTLGQAKRLVTDVRRETGLDEVLRGDYGDLTRLADHIEQLGDPETQPKKELAASAHSRWSDAASREQEYPAIGADAGGLLPDDAQVYGAGLPGTPPATDVTTSDADPATPEEGAAVAGLGEGARSATSPASHDAKVIH